MINDILLAFLLVTTLLNAVALTYNLRVFAWYYWYRRPAQPLSRRPGTTLEDEEEKWL